VLRTALQKAKIGQQDYLNRLTVLQEEYDRQKESLDVLAEKFARVNFDDVDSLYQEALELFKAGDIEACQEKLESAKLLERTDQRLQERKRIKKGKEELARQETENEKGIREDIEKLKLLVQTYLLNFELKKAEAVYDQLIKLDSTNLEILWETANFYREQHLYDKALKLYPEITIHPEAEPWQTANAYGLSGRIVYQYRKFTQCLERF
jgi:hypothetical protein